VNGARKSSAEPRAERDVWDTSDVADHFGCSLPHVHKLAREDGLPHLRLGRLWRFRRVDVLAWQDEQVMTQGRLRKGEPK